MIPMVLLIQSEWKGNKNCLLELRELCLSVYYYHTTIVLRLSGSEGADSEITDSRILNE